MRLCLGEALTTRSGDRLRMRQGLAANHDVVRLLRPPITVVASRDGSLGH
jgi:hypothetical protein